MIPTPPRALQNAIPNAFCPTIPGESLPAAWADNESANHFSRNAGRYGVAAGAAAVGLFYLWRNSNRSR